MFQHILVPLDGSRLAEAALPAAGWLAARLDSRVTLLHIIEEDAPASVHGDRHLKEPAEAAAYLAEMARRLPGGVASACHVHTAPTSRVAHGIVVHQQELAPDLIVMCSHGRSGLRQMLFGSIAQQVIGAGETPVLLVHPSAGDTPAEFACRQLLVPLDGDASHEQGLAAAARLAQATRARLRLLSVVATLGTLDGRNATSGRFLPGSTQATLQLVCEERRDYLTRETARLQAMGLDAAAELLRGDPADTIVATAESTGVDLTVMGTHGKAGSRAFWAGSVAPRVLSRTMRPVLLVPLRRN